MGGSKFSYRFLAATFSRFCTQVACGTVFFVCVARRVDNILDIHMK